MALQKFDLPSLAMLDGGRVRAAFDQLMRKAEGDCSDRPNVAAERKVTITVGLKPVATDDGRELESVDVRVTLDAAIPKKQTRTYNMRAERGGLLFNELSPDEVRQKTLDMAPRPQGTVTFVEATHDHDEKENESDAG